MAIPTSITPMDISDTPHIQQKEASKFTIRRKKFFASFFSIGFFIPLIALVLTVMLYIAPFQLFPTIGTWFVVLEGIICTIGLWIILASICHDFATAQRVNPRSYEQLTSGLIALRARLGVNYLNEASSLEDMQKQIGMDAASGATNIIALKEAHDFYVELNKLLNDPLANIGFEWFWGTSYLNAWSMLHRCQEALIEVQPIDVVLRRALYDKQAIENSSMPNKSVLLERLTRAVRELDSHYTVYFEEQITSGDISVLRLKETFIKQDEILDQIITALKQLQPSIKIDTRKLPIDKDEHDLHTSQENMCRARVILRQVQQSVNSFRDDTWERLLRGRNRLLEAIALTGIITLIMLDIAILVPDAPTKNIIAATLFYIVGAVAGLFGQFYSESTHPTTVDDYGLTLARLIATPLLSGLAGVGGVFISVVLTAINGSQLPLANIFITNPEYLFIAALFGLTPSLIIKALQQRATQYADDLQSSKGPSL